MTFNFMCVELMVYINAMSIQWIQQQMPAVAITILHSKLIYKYANIAMASSSYI